ncbi:hypothetical protein [Psychroflexus montanilacus]|uniref:hypothetical protein n=1 Tax=Psychroflexus montanilacus TaxID=2873598 RepID=UPI001CCEF6C1|nr:hypothetical protein [Psychroflexus montanilacus]MBZ9651599.1 hypothetical protein [Psychroflexus montanilacus]
MKNNSFTTKTTKQLKDYLILYKVMGLMLFTTSMFLLGICIYGLLTKEDNSTFIALTVVAISCLAVLPLQIINIKRIKSELASREEIDPR